MKLFGKNNKQASEESKVSSTVAMKMTSNEAYKELRGLLKENNYTLSVAHLDSNMELHIVAYGFAKYSPIVAVDYGELSVTTVTPEKALTAKEFNTFLASMESAKKVVDIINEFIGANKHRELAII